MRQIFIFLILAEIILGSCKKNSNNSVLLRVENKTTTNFSKVITNGVEYDNISPGTVSKYMEFDKIIASAYSEIITLNNDTTYCGLAYSDPPVSYIESGSYTLQIIADTTTSSGYNCNYIKE